jgi:hypothetical protein
MTGAAPAAQIAGDRARCWNSWPGALFGTHLGNPISAETIGWAVRDAMETPMMVTLRTWHSIFHTDFRPPGLCQEPKVTTDPYR